MASAMTYILASLLLSGLLIAAFIPGQYSVPKGEAAWGGCAAEFRQCLQDSCDGLDGNFTMTENATDVTMTCGFGPDDLFSARFFEDDVEECSKAGVSCRMSKDPGFTGDVCGPSALLALLPVAALMMIRSRP